MSRQIATNLPLETLRKRLLDIGEPAFRWKQVAKWTYQKRVERFDAMTNISKDAQRRLADNFTLGKLPQSACLVSRAKDAVKFAFSVGPKNSIESVLLFDGKRRTACLSSQLGCGLGCVFCETGKMGLLRNLTLHEVVGQVIAMNDYLAQQSDRLISNIVFMGMGEALGNFDVFASAVEILRDENCFCLGPHRITVSTAGVIPSIRKLVRSGLGVELAISLNAFSNESRSAIMPINKLYPIEALVAIAAEYERATANSVTFEYVVAAGKNDTPKALAALVRLLSRTRCKLNLIPVNPSSGSPDFAAPADADLKKFAAELFAKGIIATIRKSRGQDICGACGQLASRTSAPLKAH